ncbi:toll/interleukin-1 receptor domain-containing protein [Amycolatopsis sp. NPDC089917]|uniref:toll/interleukin-1 receptor domain-containing protein n=1 Tax=Amycolatopsis sp. NPDC089917 TaxID=3155187 RepID=UPI00343EC2A5
MVFINFRVGDGEYKAAWLAAELGEVFGKDKVFRSSSSIPLGHDYEPIMWGAVDTCSAMIVVIGDKWLSEFGQRLLQEDDVVRKEIATALKDGKPVIPVLEHTERMYKAEELPPDLAELANRQYIRITYRDRHTIPGLIERLIEAAPELGIGVLEGIEDLAAWNRARTSLTNPELPADLFMLGREKIVERLHSWLSGPPGLLSLRGQTTDEVATFVAAVLNSQNPQHRAVLVTSQAGWEQASKIPPSFPAVIAGDGISISQNQQDRHVVIAHDGIIHRQEILNLPRIPRDLARSIFLSLGLPLRQADEYAGLLRRSHRALTRRLSPNARRPSWSVAPDSTIAVPLSLVSRWSTTNEADHEMVAKVAGNDYSVVDRFAEPNALSGDPFIHRSGSRWQLADPYDAWAQLMSQVTATDIRRFSEAAGEVLGENDPVLMLPDSEVPTAGINGIGRQWSDELRQGFAHGLARLGDAGTAPVAGRPAENHASDVVYQLMKAANSDRTGLRWRSLNDVLPLLAEAAPRIFLDAVRTGLRGQEPLLRLMFEDGDGRSLYRHSAHTGLLWALETVAWSPEHSATATLLVAQLAAIDPGGRVSNRPSHTLTSLLSHRALSPIPVEKRPALINQVRKQNGEVGWQLLDDLTDHRKFTIPLEQPRVRHDWASTEPASSGAIEVYLNTVFSAILSDLTSFPNRWISYLSKISIFPQTYREKLLSTLESTDFTSLDPNSTLELWNQAKNIANYEQMGDSEYRHLSAQEVDRLSSFLEGIEPSHDPARHAWLFTWHPRIPDVDLSDYTAHQAVVESLRQKVVSAELNQHGVEGLARLAASSESGQTVGWTLAQVAGDSVRDEVLARLGQPFADGWIRCRASADGHAWATEAISTVPHDPALRSAFILALPVSLTLEQLDHEEADVATKFWELTPAFPFPDERTEEYLVEILKRERYEATIDALSMAAHNNSTDWKPSPEIIFAAFTGLLKSETQVTAHTAYAVEALVNYLHATGCPRQEVASWEIAFSSLLHNRQPRALLSWIADDPIAFVELHKFRYLPTEKINPRAMGFYMTGQRLRCIPGQNGDQVDGPRLLEWLHQVRELLRGIDMLRSGDLAIGALISAGPLGDDGAWPAEAVRDVLDLDDADDIRDGFGIGLFNNAGFSTRGVYDGGQRERSSAEKYKTWADRVENDWPYTAEVLRDFAASLKAQARHWDKEAEDDHDE